MLKFVVSAVPIVVGVPQGSSLGPLLFLLYINDMGNLPLKGKLRLFADDAASFYVGKNVANISGPMQSDLNILNDYFTQNVLSMNITKTKSIVFKSQNSRTPTNLQLSLGNTQVEQVTEYKYLGLILDETLSWRMHIASLIKKLSPLCGVLRKLSYFIPSKILLKIYFSHFHSRIQYLISIWGSAPKTVLQKLQMLQNKSLRNVYKLPFSFPKSQLYMEKAKNIFPLLGLHVYRKIIYIHKITKVTGTHSNQIISRPDHQHNTRRSSNYQIHRINTEYGRKRITFAGIVLYNNLPDGIKNMTNLSLFTRRLKAHLSDNLLQYVQ